MSKLWENGGARSPMKWREAAARTCTAPAEGSSKRSESSRKFGKPAPPRPVEPEDDAPLLNLTVGGAALNVTFNLTQDDVAAAIATAYLDRLRNRTEVLESVDARLEALTRKLAWLDSSRTSGLLGEAEHAAQKEAVLAAFRELEPRGTLNTPPPSAARRPKRCLLPRDREPRVLRHEDLVAEPRRREERRV